LAVIFETYSIAEAQCKAYITLQQAEADLWVYNTSSRGLAYSDEIWYLTKNRAEASCRLFFSERGCADLIVYFVTNRSQAGWQKNHRFNKRL